MPTTIEVERRGGIQLVTNSDPVTRNAINVDFYLGFTEILKNAERDENIRVVVLTGAGGFFCSGGNIHTLLERTKAGARERRAGVEKLHGLIRTMRACPKPIVAAVEGGAAGAGISLALACDFIVAARNAIFSAGHVKIGLTPDGGATAFLGRSLPYQLAMEMCLLGARLPADTLYQHGVVNRLSEPGEVLGDALGFAEQIAAGPRNAHDRIKALINQAPVTGLEAQLEAEANAMAASLGDEEAKEGIAAFFEKRQAKFQ